VVHETEHTAYSQCSPHWVGYPVDLSIAVLCSFKPRHNGQGVVSDVEGRWCQVRWAWAGSEADALGGWDRAEELAPLGLGALAETLIICVGVNGSAIG